MSCARSAPDSSIDSFWQTRQRSLAADGPGARLQGGVGQTLAGLDRWGGQRDQQEQGGED